MIVDNINEAVKYYGMNPLFKKAFEYFNQIDIHSTETVTIELAGARLQRHAPLIGEGVTKKIIIKVAVADA